jgi:hypothetical protein
MDVDMVIQQKRTAAEEELGDVEGDANEGHYDYGISLVAPSEVILYYAETT